MGLPTWLNSKESVCKSGDTGLIPWRRKWQCMPVFLPGKFRGQRSWQATVHGVANESYKTETTPWTAAYQAPPSMGFSRQDYWSGVPLPSPKQQTKYRLNIITNNNQVLYIFLNILKHLESNYYFIVLNRNVHIQGKRTLVTCSISHGDFVSWLVLENLFLTPSPIFFKSAKFQRNNIPFTSSCNWHIYFLATIVKHLSK